MATAFLSALTSACTSLANSRDRIDLLGDPASLTAAERTVVITASTRYVTVIGGEKIKFLVGERAFAWNFDGITEGYRFNLNVVAPEGILDHTVLAYVRANPRYPNGR